MASGSYFPPPVKQVEIAKRRLPRGVRAEAEKLLAAIAGRLKECKLELHPEGSAAITKHRRVNFKLDENLSPSLAEIFVVAGHDAHSVVQQALVLGEWAGIARS